MSRIHELQDFELSDADWKAIELLTRWLKTFHSTTTQMSMTKISMLSMMHAIFWELQDHLKKMLQSLPDGISLHLRDGVIVAHEKLSEYYYKYNESPLYT